LQVESKLVSMHTRICFILLLTSSSYHRLVSHSIHISHRYSYKSWQLLANQKAIINIDDDDAFYTDDYKTRFSNVARLYNSKEDMVLSRLRTSHVLIIGLGGVGSWVVEALARSGINNLYLIDLDDICVSNINRQLPALTSTVGRFKGEVLKERVLDINPHSNVTFIADFLRPENMVTIFSSIPKLNYVIDCADGVTDKAAIIDYCAKRGIPIVVSGGAGGITDPTLIRTSDMARKSHHNIIITSSLSIHTFLLLYY
jgi:tRNA A37 threonylcarbamoyladenosine dehydratase